MSIIYKIPRKEVLITRYGNHLKKLLSEREGSSYYPLRNQPAYEENALFLLWRNHARQKTKRGDRYRIAMGLRALTASSGLTPGSIAVDCTSAA